MKKKYLRISETGYDNEPGIFVFRVDEKDKRFMRLESCLIRQGSFLRMTKKQAAKVAKFLQSFSRSKT